MEHDTRRHNTAATLTCIIGFLLFNWPLLSIAAEQGALQPLIYLYTVWMVFVIALWWLSRRAAAAFKKAIHQEQQP